MEDGGDDGGEEATKASPDRLQSIAFIFASPSDDQIPTVGTDPSKKANGQTCRNEKLKQGKIPGRSSLYSREVRGRLYDQQLPRGRENQGDVGEPSNERSLKCE
ncbi:hypothetical protein RIB2604_00301190 [Aspergillus luchuensis]|uniref:Uncharacterized protein n=1 Tax=Aspergillus kawachii TaxID=1069201 RepID=A0A146EZN4_ASPKA|nr:hypothetical protein RIB2604_00301190 [Aspergillus luchuensis]